MVLVDDFNAHRAGGTGDDLDSAFEVDGVHLGHFFLSDFFELGASNLADFFGVWATRAFFELNRFADKVVNRLSETSPVERAVFVDTDMYDDVFTHEIFGGLVEGADEVHHVKTPLTEGRANWRPSGGFATWDAELEVADDFFVCHKVSLAGSGEPTSN